MQIENQSLYLFNVKGSSKVLVDDGNRKEIIDLDKPNKGVYIGKMVWKDMYGFSDDSVLLVLSSSNYDPDEYIRDYDEYIEIMNKEKLSE